ncbi:MAG: hypothetical protein RIS36_2263 [Pseudomonadota bacterium]
MRNFISPRSANLTGSQRLPLHGRNYIVDLAIHGVVAGENPHLNTDKGHRRQQHERRTRCELDVRNSNRYDGSLSYGIVSTRNTTFRVDDLIELHHPGGKERLAPV